MVVMSIREVCSPDHVGSCELEGGVRPKDDIVVILRGACDDTLQMQASMDLLMAARRPLHTLVDSRR